MLLPQWVQVLLPPLPPLRALQRLQALLLPLRALSQNQVWVQAQPAL